MSALIHFQQVSKTLNKKPVLNQFELQLEADRIIGLLGPNGSGKTTLIKLLNGLIQPDQGQILIDGKQPGVATKALVSYLPDRTYLNPEQPIQAILQFFKDFYADFDYQRAQQLLKDLSIDANAKIKHLSKGEQEKVQLILVMSRQAKIYLLDEPLGGVDPVSRDYILKTIINNYAPGALILIATHLIRDIEPIIDEVIMLDHGQIICHHNVEDLRYETGLSIEAQFRQHFG